jgi:hypothetical protein
LSLLDEVDAQAAIDAMSRINNIVLRSAFIDALLCVSCQAPRAMRI